MDGPRGRGLSRSRWRATPRQLALLFAGLLLFGAGEALIVQGQMGNSPWTVLAQGCARTFGIEIGQATIILSALVLAAWIPLRQKPGLGTISNAIVVGLALDATLTVVPEADPFAARLGLVLGGIALVAIGSALYLGVRLGPGPRDGLMTGLHRTTGVSVRSARLGVEATALVAGFALGGTVGLGTLLFALLIGPAVQLALAIGGVDAAEL